MIYASHYPCVTVVAAADSLAEAEVFYSNVQATCGDLVVEHGRPDFMEMMTDDTYSSLQYPPFVFRHPDDAARDAFAAREKLSIVGPRVLVDRQADMLSADAPDVYLDEIPDQRTIKEIHGLEQHDPWDVRTDEQKEQDEHYKKLAEEAKKNGNLSGDSFSGGGKKKQVHITDVRTTSHADGSISIDDVLAVKGLHDKDVKDSGGGTGGGQGEGQSGAGGDGGEEGGGGNISSDPADYIFAVNLAEEGLFVTITNKAIWETETRVDDQELAEALGHVLGEGYHDVTEATFETPFADKDAIIADLTGKGFTYSPDLEAALDNPDPVFGIELEESDEEEVARPEPARRANPMASIYAATLGVPAEVFAGADPARTYHLFRVEGPDADGLDPGQALPLLKIDPNVIIGQGKTAKGAAFLLDVDDAAGQRVISYLSHHLQVPFSVVRVRGNGQMIDKVTFDAAKAAEIDPEGVIAIYFKVEVPLDRKIRSVGDLASIFTSVNFEAAVALAGFDEKGTFWVVFQRQASAEKLASIVGKTAYGVNDLGERLAPEGVTVVDVMASQDDLVRPWNREAEFNALSEEEKAEVLKTVTPKEFLICGADVVDVGVIFYVAPRRYFHIHGAMWGESLPIGKFLAADIKELAPGIYKTTARDWNHISFELNKAGFTEDLFLQLHINNL